MTAKSKLTLLSVAAKAWKASEEPRKKYVRLFKRHYGEVKAEKEAAK